MLIEISPHHICLRIDEARVEVALEHDQHALDRGVGYQWFPRLAGEGSVPTNTAEGACRHQISNKLTSSHFEFRPSHFNLPCLEASCSIIDRKSTRLNSSHLGISYAVFCLKK